MLVDTSVWSPALRRDTVADAAQVRALRRALEGDDEMVVTTGGVLQELLQGFTGPRAGKHCWRNCASGTDSSC